MATLFSFLQGGFFRKRGGLEKKLPIMTIIRLLNSLSSSYLYANLSLEGISPMESSNYTT